MGEKRDEKGDEEEMLMYLLRAAHGLFGQIARSPEETGRRPHLRETHAQPRYEPRGGHALKKGSKVTDLWT